MMNQKSPPIKITVLSGANLSVFGRGHILSTVDKCGLFFCRCGEVELEIDGSSYTIRKGDIYFYMASALVRLKRMSSELSGAVLEVELDYILPLSHKMMTIEDILYLRDHPCVTLNESEYSRLDWLLETYYKRSWEEVETGYIQLCFLQNELMKSFGQLLFCELMTAYYAHKGIRSVSRNQKDFIFQRFLQTLFRCYRKERDVAFYAHDQNLSARYFSSIIKEKSGRSALQWIVRMVISEAKQLLESSDATIKEIAIQLNFPTQSFFGKYFKQYVGLSPRDYRIQVLSAEKGEKKRKR